MKALRRFFYFLCLLLSLSANAQAPKDSTSKRPWWSFHFQQTVIPQYHPDFKAAYSDTFSLQPSAESQVSLTTTFFMGARLWKNAEVYFNPELAGGSGLSQARGVAGFTNGETFRIGNPKPQIYLARLFLKQIFPLSKNSSWKEDAANVVAGPKPDAYLAVSVGKFSIADYFDQNKYSHDPRSQFLNWALMSNGGWDYPANTRGYTVGYVLELVKPRWAARISSVMVPEQANGNVLDKNIRQAHSNTAEITRSYSIGGKTGTLRMLGFYTNARMGSYANAVQQAGTQTPEIATTRSPGRNKYGFGLNAEQDLTDHAGIFLRASWNDGKNETWAFTEIDRSISAGLVMEGNSWKREDDIVGIAMVVNGISAMHQSYLAHGGHGFMIGDGRLNYSPEVIGEVFYNFHLHEQHFWVSPDYQFIINPAYNSDRGPAHVFAMRFHVEF